VDAAKAPVSATVLRQSHRRLQADRSQQAAGA